MNSYPHPQQGCDLAGQGSSNRLMITALAALFGGAAGLLLIPVFVAIITLAAIPLGVSRLAQWLSGDLMAQRASKSSLTPKF